MFGIVDLSALWFIILILIFYILAINKKQIWSPEADTRTLDYS